MRPRAAAEETEIFLRLLADPARPPIAAEGVALVVAHPDDETLACGAQLPRLRGITVVLVTDGAPRNLKDARAQGFATADAYAAARFQEMQNALARAHVPAQSLLPLGVPDQRAAFHLCALTLRLRRIFAVRKTRIALTHAYEGGHPDHDATAFATHMACRILGADVIEMPLYGAAGMQRFLEDARCPEWIVALGDAERAGKASMIAEHRTQQTTLQPFSLDCERFRRAPDYDFTKLPLGGRLFYESFDWGLDGATWTGVARQALEELEARPWA